jgi:glycosyltransferase 2 family protein
MTTAMKRKTRRWAAIALKAAISVALIVWLVDRVELRPVLDRLARITTPAALVTLGLVAAQIVLVMGRWYLVARIIGATLRPLATARFVLIGLFFSQTLPSTVGGDAVRVWLLTREGMSLGKGVNVVLCDRMLALTTLLALIGLTLPLLFARVADGPARSGVALVVVVAALGLALFLALRERLDPWLARWRMVRPLAGLARDFHMLFRAPRGSVATFGLAAAVHLLNITIIWVLAVGLGIDVGWIDCLVLFPPVVIAMVLPISIAGWGVREGVMIVAFGFVGVAPADALALSAAFGVSQMVGGLPGALLWLQGRRERAAATGAGGAP